MTTKQCGSGRRAQADGEKLHFAWRLFVKRTVLLICAIFLAAPWALSGQSSSANSGAVSSEPGTGGGAGVTLARPPRNAPAALKPFSRIALGGGVSPLGVNMQIATNLNRHLNLRGTGHLFQYTVNNISTNGFLVDAKLDLASAGASVDYYPFAGHGFRLSPGALFLNNNAASATYTVQPGTSFSLNGYTYYASSSNPVRGTGNLGLHSQSPAFTATTGWGNVIPRKGGHLSFPFELGVAFIGSPTLNIALTSGQVCDAQGQNCVDVATDEDVQNNLQAQIAKYKHDLDPLKTYPIVTFGVAYNFRVR
jgi:hypothetical protein